MPCTIHPAGAVVVASAMLCRLCGCMCVRVCASVRVRELCLPALVLVVVLLDLSSSLCIHLAGGLHMLCVCRRASEKVLRICRYLCVVLGVVQLVQCRLHTTHHVGSDTCAGHLHCTSRKEGATRCQLSYVMLFPLSVAGY